MTPIGIGLQKTEDQVATEITLLNKEIGVLNERINELEGENGELNAESRFLLHQMMDLKKEL